MSSLLSFSTWAEERGNGHGHGLCWPASSIWKYHLLEEQNRNGDKTILISYICPQTYMLSLTPDFPNSDETVIVKEFLKA